MNFYHHKDLGNHLLQLCPKVVKHSVYKVVKHPVYKVVKHPIFFHDNTVYVVTLSQN